MDCLFVEKSTSKVVSAAQKASAWGHERVSRAWVCIAVPVELRGWPTELKTHKSIKAFVYFVKEKRSGMGPYAQNKDRA